MDDNRVTVEHVLNSKSPSIIWALLSTPEGLAKWIADEVKAVDGKLMFVWGNLAGNHEIRMAEILGRRNQEYIRFRWDEERFKDTFWELRMEKSELTDDYNLLITDFVVDYDRETMIDIWNANIESLHRSTGL
ncbi:MAG: START-like domain-containing protein [Prevotella sp.]